MRKLLVLLIIPLFSIAQNNINYQAIVSNSDGNAGIDFDDERLAGNCMSISVDCPTTTR